MGAAPLGGNCERRKVPASWEAPSLVWPRTEREFDSLRGKCNRHFSVARAQGELHRWSMLMSCTPQPDTDLPVLVQAEC